MTKKEQAKERSKRVRADLAARSMGFRLMLKEGMEIEGFEDCETVNDCLQKQYMEETGKTNVEDWNIFKGWKENGLKVKKGEHGFPIWGKPRQMKFKETVQDADTGETSEAEKEYKRFPICYLFHVGQVEAIEKPVRTGEGTDADPIRYEKVKADDPQRKEKLEIQREQFVDDAKDGKILVLSDLMCSHGM